MVNDNTYNPNLSLSQAYSWGQMQRVSANLTKKNMKTWEAQKISTIVLLFEDLLVQQEINFEV